MASAGAGSPTIPLLVLAAFVWSGCLDGPSSEGADGPSDSNPDDAGPVEVFSPGWPAVDDAVIRPGVKFASGGVSGDCTANFIFSTPDNRTLYIGTTSHCVVGLAPGDPVSVAAGAVTGTLAYCSWGPVDRIDTCPSKVQTDDGWANDFALVELPGDARTLVHPAVLHWGGPTGILESPPPANQHVLTFGDSSLRDTDQPGPGSAEADAREGFTAAPITPLPTSPEWSTYVRFATPSIPGDQGSPVLLADGKALGILNPTRVFEEGANSVTLLDPVLAYLHNNSELQIELKTYGPLADPLLPGSGVIATKAQDANAVHAA